MGFPMHINAIMMGCPLYILRGHSSEFLNYDVCQSVKIVLASVKNEDPKGMQHYASFHLGLHYLPKYPFRGFKNINQAGRPMIMHI